MGNRFVVKVYEHPNWREVYRGEEMADALKALMDAKFAGSLLVVLEWR
jgi:hypothetical protein